MATLRAEGRPAPGTIKEAYDKLIGILNSPAVDIDQQRDSLRLICGTIDTL